MMISMRRLVTTLLVVWLCCASSALPAQPVTFHVVQDSSAGTISVLLGGSRDVVLVQNAQERIRPFLHPIMPPDGKGMLTASRPSHHPHQTGVYWGLKATNGRDFFMTCCVPGEERYHRRVSASVLQESGARVSWRTVYNLLDERGQTILVETKTWSIQEQDRKYLLDLEWRGDAKRAVTVERFYVGGLFIRMPWHKGIAGEVINAAGQRNNQAEQQRAIWADVGMAIAGRDDWGHIAILDHPDNTGFPIAWRVDSELGVGPSRQILQNWRLTEGESEVTRYRLIVYTGQLDPTVLHRAWTAYAGGSR
jgi:hypothetical protein